MNVKQKIVMWLGIAAMVFLIVYPPWTKWDKDDKERIHLHRLFTIKTGCTIYSPPPSQVFWKSKEYRNIKHSYCINTYSGDCTYEIDIVRLLMEVSIVTVVAGGLIVTMGFRPRSSQKE